MRYILLSLVLLFSASCSDEFTPIDFEKDVNLPEEYTYEISTSCFCPIEYIGPHFLHIRGSQIVDYELLADGMLQDSAFISTLTIEAITTRVNSILDQDPVVSNVETHPIYGFPVSAYFDISEMIADEEWGFDITNFEVIED